MPCVHGVMGNTSYNRRQVCKEDNSNNTMCKFEIATAPPSYLSRMFHSMALEKSITIDLFWYNGKLILFIMFLLFPTPLLLAWIDLNLLFQIKILS